MNILVGDVPSCVSVMSTNNLKYLDFFRTRPSH